MKNLKDIFKKGDRSEKLKLPTGCRELTEEEMKNIRGGVPYVPEKKRSNPNPGSAH